MKKFIISVCTVFFIGGACFLANAVKSNEGSMTKTQIENANSIMSGPVVPACLNNSNDRCMAICPLCGNDNSDGGTGTYDENAGKFCKFCSAGSK